MQSRKLVSTNEAAVQRLVALGTIARSQGKQPKAKTILRYIQKAEKERKEREKQLAEDFKDFIP